MALLFYLGLLCARLLCHFQPATCSVYLQGTTGTYKSADRWRAAGFLWFESLMALHLPANWSSTGNALEKTAFLAKDCLFVVDDFVARGTRQEVAYTHRNAERLLRAQGNQSGRSRMTRKAEIRNAFHPRGIVSATGEDVPNGHSLQARLVTHQRIARGPYRYQGVKPATKDGKRRYAGYGHGDLCAMAGRRGQSMTSWYRVY